MTIPPATATRLTESPGLAAGRFARRLDALAFALDRQPGLLLIAKLPNGDHSIHRFAKDGLTDIVAHLLDQGADPYLTGREGNSVCTRRWPPAT